LAVLVVLVLDIPHSLTERLAVIITLIVVVLAVVVAEVLVVLQVALEVQVGAGVQLVALAGLIPRVAVLQVLVEQLVIAQAVMGLLHGLLLEID
jgi:hypothetical protein